MKIRNFLKLVLSTFAFFAIVQSAFAIGISPAKTEIDINPGETQTLIIKAYNNTDNDMENVVTEIEAFYKNDERGYPIVGEAPITGKYELSEWITYSDTGFELKAREIKPVTITLAIPEDFEPGGKYIEVLFSNRPITNETNGSSGVKIVSRAASLLLIKVSGDIQTTGEIENLEMSTKLQSDQPIPFSLTFKNNGNVHIKPVGDIKITNTKTGKELINTGMYIEEEDEAPIITSSILINRTGGNVLPGSNRIFTGLWGQNFQNGKFTATADISYDDHEPRVTKQLDFEINESVEINNFKINISPKSSNFTFSITNTGNVIERLTGFISITNAFGYEVAKIDLPEDMEFVNPGDTKDYQIEWIQTDMPEGSYKATLRGTLGLTKENVKASVSFGEITNTGYVIGGIALLIIVGLLFLLFRKKRKS